MSKILGIDEVGRGPLAGPLVVGAVILPENKPDWTIGLRDSKQLTARRRKELAKIIRKRATATGLGWVSAGEIDKMGMTQALKLATRRAVEAVQQQKIPFSEIIIDGNINFLEGTRLERYTTTIIKGDGLIKEISAASIIAKQARDNYMCEIAREYPEYGFERHMGYGTELHREMIQQHGLCPEHRRLVKLVQDVAKRDGEDTSRIWQKEPAKNTTKIGNRGETAVCEYLVEQDHTILIRNFKTKYYEIDIISTEADKIYFTEVKYRSSDVAGGGLAAIDTKKFKKMEFAARCFMRFRQDLVNKYSPVLAVAEVAGSDFKVREWLPLV